MLFLMRISAKVKNNISDYLSHRIRGAAVFAPKEALKSKRIVKKTAEELHTLVSSLMQQTYLQHIEDKKKNILDTLKHRELIYVDASKKWDMDLFSYMTRCYFNNCTEGIRTKYNAMVASSHPELFDEIVWSDDKHFDRQIDEYKKLPQRQEEWSDLCISRMPFHNMDMLMHMNDQTDLNIFLDNVATITATEMGYINNAIRWWLLVGHNQRRGLYVNNTKNTWNFREGDEKLPPQDGHDMRVIYI